MANLNQASQIPILACVLCGAWENFSRSMTPGVSNDDKKL
jgi:hypothetical protein